MLQFFSRITYLSFLISLFSAAFLINSDKADGLGLEDSEGRTTIRVYERQATAAVTENVISCNATSVSLIAAATTRVKAMYKNTSATGVYICYATVCTTSVGMLFTQDEGYTEYNYIGPITCITASGSSPVAVKELQ